MLPLQRPEGFQYIEPEAGNPPRMAIKEGFINGQFYVGGTNDISKVKDYHYDESSGKLTVELKNQFRIHRQGSLRIGEIYRKGGLLIEESMPALHALDAILTQLAITIFKAPNGETLCLLKGNSSPRICIVDHLEWGADCYDSDNQRKIDFNAINDFAFDINTYSIELDGSRFSIILKNKYKDNASVQYAIHNVLGEACGIRRVKQLSNGNSVDKLLCLFLLVVASIYLTK